MAAITSTLPTAVLNRRRRVRHKIQTPAYAIFTAKSQGAMLDLHEIVDISEEGMSIQCHSPLEMESQMDLCLDLADCSEHIFTSGRVIWANASGRVGFRFSPLAPDSLSRLREWLFVNVMAGVANGEAEIAGFNGARRAGPPPPSYTDTLAAVSSVRRQVETLGADLKGALQLIAERAQALARASGVAIALADEDPDFMVCRATSGADAPPVGARLHIGSGFSGACAKSGVLLRCDDTELDARVDRESCQALGIRSILAVPIRAGEESVGLIEAFSPQPNSFSEGDGKAFQKLAETVLDAANRAALAENMPPLGPPPEEPFTPPGSVLFAAADQAEQQQNEEKKSAGITLPRSHLLILVGLAITIPMALGYGLAPWIQTDVVPYLQHKLQARENTQLQTVLASSQPPSVETSASSRAPSIETATLAQLRQLAELGNPDAQNALGLRYATGEGVVLNETEAVRWFTKAAEQGNVPSQSKLGAIYYSGRGVRQDPSQAYFWIVVARASGDDASKTLAPFVSALLPHARIRAIELDADRWLQQHRTSAKPDAGQLKASYITGSR